MAREISKEQPCEFCGQPTEDRYRMMVCCKNCKPKVAFYRNKKREEAGKYDR